jgi:hypothetical protein
MRNRARTRKSQSLAKRFAVYSAVGGACGLTFGATAAEAGIVYTDFHGVATKDTALAIDVDQNGTDDFIFSLTISPERNFTNTYSNWAALDGGAGNAFAWVKPSPDPSGVAHGPANLAKDVSVAGQNFYAGIGPMQLAYHTHYTSHFFGPFGGQFDPFGPQDINPASGYVGLNFASDGGQMAFGWVKVTIEGNVLNDDIIDDDLHFSAAEIRIDGFAYATGGGDILTGQQVPEPTSAALTSLGLLAMGAMGLAERRRRRKLAAG